MFATSAGNMVDGKAISNHCEDAQNKHSQDIAVGPIIDLPVSMINYFPTN